MNIIKGKSPAPRRVLLYGTHGVGKSTWAAQAPSPLVIQTEDGLDDIGCDRTPLCKTIGDVSSAISWLITQEHAYKTVVIDTLDWMERLIWQATAERGGKASIEDFGYGKGYTLAIKGWQWILSSLGEVRTQKKMNVILLAHAKVQKVEPPDGDSYDRYEPDLHKSASPLLQEWCDEVFFTTYEVRTVKKDEAFGRERTRAIGSGDRVVHTCERPAWLAKRRIDLPDTIGLDWREYQAGWPQARAAMDSGNVAGIVKDGSSKQKGAVA